MLTRQRLVQGNGERSPDILTTLPGVGVVVNGEAAWAIKPLPTTVTDMFPGLGRMVIKVIGIHGSRSPRRRRPAFWVQLPLEVWNEKSAARGGRRRPLRVGTRAHSVEHELRSDEVGTRFRVVVAWFDEIFARG